MSQDNREMAINAMESAQLVHSTDAIDQALSALATAITADYEDLNPVLLTIMNGGLVFAGQLLPRLRFPLELDYCHATRYHGATSGGELLWKVTPQADLVGRHVLILDDVLDEGHTLLELIGNLQALGVASVRTAVMVEKLHQRKASPGMRADYTGLTAPDKYLFGFGMDYRHYWRNTDAIYCLDD